MRRIAYQNGGTTSVLTTFMRAVLFVNYQLARDVLKCPLSHVFPLRWEDVKKDLLNYFESELSQKLEIFDGSTEGSNLTYDVQIVTQHEKTSAIISLIKKEIPNSEDGAR